MRLGIQLPGQNAVVEQELVFYANVPPSAGHVTATPCHGIALNHSFAISALQFVDEDQPLTYRFGCRTYERTTHLADSLASSTTSALLPQGSDSFNFTYHVIVDVSDLYGASSSSSSDVTVRPYVKDPLDSWTSVAQQELNGSNATHWHTTAQLMSSIATALNGASESVRNASAIVEEDCAQAL